MGSAQFDKRSTGSPRSRSAPRSCSPDGSAVFAPVIGMLGGIAAMALANHERLKQRVEALEKRLAQAEWRRGQSRRVNSRSEISGAIVVFVGARAVRQSD